MHNGSLIIRNILLRVVVHLHANQFHFQAFIFWGEELRSFVLRHFQSVVFVNERKLTYADPHSFCLVDCCRVSSSSFSEESLTCSREYVTCVNNSLWAMCMSKSIAALNWSHWVSPEGMTRRQNLLHMMRYLKESGLLLTTNPLFPVFFSLFPLPHSDFISKQSFPKS